MQDIGNPRAELRMDLPDGTSILGENWVLAGRVVNGIYSSCFLLTFSHFRIHMIFQLQKSGG